MPFLSITWRAVDDDRTCKVCRAINGYTWNFELGVDAFPPYLEHPTHGVVWDTARGSQAHGHKSDNCRCHVATEFHLSDMVARVRKLYEDVVEKYGPVQEASL